MTTTAQPTPQTEEDALNFTADKMGEANQKNEEQEAQTQLKTAVKKAQMREQVKAQVVKPDTTAIKRAAADHAKRSAQLEKDMEMVETRQNIEKINLYMSRFGAFLSTRIPKMSARPSLAESQETLDSIRTVMNNQMSVNTIAGYFNTGFVFLEKMWGDGQKMTMVPEELRFNLKGISTNYQQSFNTDFLPLIYEVDIEYPWLGRQSMALRLISSLTKVMLTTHMMNVSPSAKKMADLDSAKPLDTEAEAGAKGLAEGL